MDLKKAPHFPGSSSVNGFLKSDASKEVWSSITTTNEGALPYFKRYDWCSSLSESNLTQLKISYNIQASISFELPPHGVFGNEGYASKVAITRSFL